MPRLKLKSATLRNFGSVRQSTVDFPDHGFVLVNGLNETGAGKLESVGSGKTLLGEAISRALFNVPGRFPRLSGFSTGGRGDTYVSVKAEMDGKGLHVELGYKCPELNKGGEGLRFTLDGEGVVQRATMDQTRGELAKLVGLTPEVAAWTVYIDGSALNFSRLSETQSVSLLMGALNQPPWQEYQVKAKKAKDEFQGDLKAATSAHSTATATAKSAKSSLDQAVAALGLAQRQQKAVSDAWQTRKSDRDQRISAAKLRQLDLESSARKLRQQIEEAVQAEASAYAEAQLRVNDWDSRLAAAKRDSTVKATHKTRLERALKELEGRVAQARSAARRALMADFESARANLARRKKDCADSATKSSAALTKAVAELAALDLAVAKLEAVPTACPLSGCVKEWPRPNQAKLDSCLVDRTAKATDVDRLRLVDTEARQELADANALPDPVAPEIDEAAVQIPAELSAELARAMGGLDTAESECAAATDLAGTTETDRDLARKVLDGLTQASAVGPMSRQLEELDGQLGIIEKLLGELALAQAEDVLDESGLHRAEASEAECRRQSTEADFDVARLSADLADATQAVAVAEYWSEAFSPTGIPNLIIDESIAPLNGVSRRVGFAMTSGILSVSYATNRVLASGKSRSEIVMTVGNLYGSDAANGSSKGEAGLTDLIVAETLAEVGNVANRVGYRWYDEVARSQDPCVRRSLFSYLQELSQRLGILFFVVDHSPEVANYADYVLRARKTSSGTEYAWQ